MFVKRYGFKDLLHIKNYHRRRIYGAGYPLQTAFSILEASLCRFVVRVGWARSIKLAAGIVRLGGVDVGLHRTYSPRFLVKGLTTVSLRSRPFRASVRATIKCIRRTRVSKPPMFSSRQSEKIKNNPNY
jgi:ribosomal protein S4